MSACRTPVLLGVIVVTYNRGDRPLPMLRPGVLAELRSHGAKVIICDNSEHRNDLMAANCLRENVDYRWMGGNKGLPKAYNFAVSRLAGQVSHVVFFDDDTEIPRGYFNKLTDHLLAGTADIYMPAVYVGDRLLSPCQVLGSWYREIRHPGKLPRRYSCINTGMTVGSELLEKVQFDEILFLDYVDHSFVRAAHAAGATFEALWDCQLRQDYSRATDTVSKAASRFDLFRRDLSTFYGDTPARRTFGHLIVAWRAVRAGFKYRTTYFVRRVFWTR